MMNELARTLCMLSPMRHERGGTYLLTWTTYATWLPGDGRGFVSPIREESGEWAVYNQLGTPYAKGAPQLTKAAERRVKGDEVVLDQRGAAVVIMACHEVCATHELVLNAAAVMRTHVHMVVASRVYEGAKLLQLFKGVSSRRLTQRFGRPCAPRWWTSHGSRRLLIDPDSINAAAQYVRQQANILASHFPYTQLD
ncbi:MAG: transposase [Phycisphaerales bacterium]|nr:transposase [Phycisphaerales bacterium]